jgi:hypothetical protein
VCDPKHGCVEHWLVVGLLALVFCAAVVLLFR